MYMDVITNIDEFMKRQKDAGFGKPLVVIIITAILAAISGYISAPANVELQRYMLSKLGVPSTFMQSIVSLTYVSSIVGPIIGVFVIWIVFAVVLYLISMIFGGEGDFKTLLKLLAYSFIPSIIVSPVHIYMSYYLSKAFERGVYYGLSALKSIKTAGIVIGLAVLLWQYIYWVYALKNGRNLAQKDAAITAAVLFAAFVILQIYSLFSHGVSTL